VNLIQTPLRDDALKVSPAGGTEQGHAEPFHV